MKIEKIKKQIQNLILQILSVLMVFTYMFMQKVQQSLVQMYRVDKSIM